MTTVIIADDHPLLREGLKALLELEDEIEVIGEAGDGLTAVQRCVDLTPDVIIMDVGLPDLNGIDATRRIISEVPETRVVGLSMHTSTTTLLEMLRAGASGYVFKASARHEIAKAVQTVAEGGHYLDSTASSLVVGALNKDSSDGLESVFTVLSPREREVVQMIAEGCSPRVVAAALGISLRTVTAHRQNAMEKLGVETEAGLARYAVREGLVQLDD